MPIVEVDLPANKPEEVKQEELVIHTLLYGSCRCYIDIKQTLLQLEKAIANK